MTTHAAGQADVRAIDALLAGYASGALSPPLYALVASHLAISPQNRGFVSFLEAAHGCELEQREPAALSNRDAMLAAIFEQPEVRPERSVRLDPVLPPPLVRYMGCGLQDVPWKRLLPGVREYKVADAPDYEAVLYWIRAGRKMPQHTHEGAEITLVLQGAFSDVYGHYARGDISVADQDVEHRPIADPGEDCICFAVTDAPLRLTGPIGRVMQRIFGH